jgi:predicted metal-dependent HD superfamily phosphohydrolase
MKFSTDYIKGMLAGQIDVCQVGADFIFNLYECLLSLGVKSARSEAIAGSVYSLMSDEDLRYHTPWHVISIFQWAEQNNITLEPWEQLALWFHDAIYVPGKNDNEVRSGQFMRAVLPSGISEIDYAHAGILGTAAHDIDPVVSGNFEFDLLMDLDLCMFAWPYPEYKAASDLVAAELIPVYGPEKYKQGRHDFLSGFFHRTSVFRSKLFLDNHELHAKTNILKTLSEN